jgi:hypothetical protein
MNITENHSIAAPRFWVEQVGPATYKINDDESDVQLPESFRSRKDAQEIADRLNTRGVI